MYNYPHVGNSIENRAFKTTAAEIFLNSDISAIIDG
jgi:hypothetical protein